MGNYPLHEDYKEIDKYPLPEWVLDLVASNGAISLITEIVPGMSADQLLEIMPRIIMTHTKVLGQDSDGYVVEWHYPDVIFTLAYAKTTYESAYVIQQIQVKDEHN